MAHPSKFKEVIVTEYYDGAVGGACLLNEHDWFKFTWSKYCDGTQYRAFELRKINAKTVSALRLYDSTRSSIANPQPLPIKFVAWERFGAIPGEIHSVILTQRIEHGFESIRKLDHYTLPIYKAIPVSA